VLAHHLQDFVPAHQSVVDEVNHTHPAPTEFLLDFVVRMLGEARRKRIRGGRRRAFGRVIAVDQAQRQRVESHRRRFDPRGAGAFQERVGRELGDPVLTMRALFEVRVHRLRQNIIEPPRAV
jgi:hypothetical protein